MPDLQAVEKSLRSTGPENSRCQHCLRGKPAQPANDFRRWWLDRFDDESLAAAASVIAGVPLRAEHIETVARARHAISHVRSLRSEYWSKREKLREILALAMALG